MAKQLKHSLLGGLLFLFLQFQTLLADQDDHEEDDNNDDFWSNIQSFENRTYFGEDFSTFLMVIGIFFWPLIIFMGYRIFKVTIFTIGGLTCGLLGAHIAASSGESTLICALLFIILFIIGGSLLVCCFHFGVFVIGDWAGTFLGLAFVNAFFPGWIDNSPLELWVTLLLFGIVGGIIALRYERVIIIAATSGLGSYLWFLGWDQLTPGHPNKYGFYAGVVLFFGLGCYVQHKITSPEDDAHPMTKTFIPSKSEFQGYKSRTIIIVYGRNPNASKSLASERRVNVQRERRGARRQREARRDEEEPMMTNPISNTSPIVYANEVHDEDGSGGGGYVAPAYAVPIEDNSDLMSVKLLDWFAFHGITERSALVNIAPLFKQVGATDPLEIAHIVMDKQVGEAWLHALEQTLPLAKRRTIFNSINEIVDNSYA